MRESGDYSFLECMLCAKYLTMNDCEIYEYFANTSLYNKITELDFLALLEINLEISTD